MKRDTWIIVGVVAIIAIIAFFYFRGKPTTVVTEGGEAKISLGVQPF